MKVKESYFISICWIIIFFFIFLDKETFTQNINFDIVASQLSLNEDFGFITKEEGLPFLVANSLIDTAIKSKTQWNRINPTDTIGRYFRIKNSDNFLMCLPYSLDFFRPSYLLMEISSDGELLKSEKYDFGGSSEWNDDYKNFFKFNDDFWGILKQDGFGMGQYYYCHLYLFKELVPQDSLNYIRSDETKILVKGKRPNYETIIKGYRLSSYKDIGSDKLIIDYILRRGGWNDDELTPKFKRKKKKITVTYFYENGKWKTDDTSKIKKIEQFMKIKPPYRFM